MRDLKTLRASARQPKPHSSEFQIRGLSLVGGTVIHGTTGLDLAWITTAIDGRQWHVMTWETFNHCPSAGGGWRLVIFSGPRVTNGEVVVHDLKLNAFFQCAVQKGWLRSGEYLMAIDLGWEMDSGGAGDAIDDYALSGVK